MPTRLQNRDQRRTGVMALAFNDLFEAGKQLATALRQTDCSVAVSESAAAG